MDLTLSHPRKAGLVLLLGLAACTTESMTPPQTALPEPQPSPAAATAAASLPPPEGGKPLMPAVAATYPGSGNFIRGRSAAPAPAAKAEDNDIALNFANADVREAAREVLGNILHLNYVVDGKIQATITLQTGRPLSRKMVLPAFEAALHANGLALVETGDLYRIMPIEEASRATPPASFSGNGDKPGFATRVLPLKWVSAAELRRTMDPFIAAGSVVEADASRNLLLLSGPQEELVHLTELVNLFDVDWLKGLSFAVFPLHVDTAQNVVREMAGIFGPGADGPLAGVVKFVPMDRLNAILVTTTQPRYLEKVKTWIERLDYGNDETTPRVFQYQVQNSRAVDLAEVLTQLFSGRSGRNSASSVTAPGTRSVDLFSTRTPGSLSSSGQNGGLGSGHGSAASASASGGILSGSRAGIADSLGGLDGIPPSNPADRPGDPDAGLSNLSPSGDLPEMPHIRVVADEKNNALVIFAKPGDYRMVEAVVKKLDIVPLQVQIEATIAEVTLNDNLQYGLQFFLKTGANTVTLSPSAKGVIGAIFPGFNYTLATRNQETIISALKEVSQVNVVSSPQLLVLDHHSAILQVGDQVPIPVQQSQSQLTPNAPLVSTIDYHDTGVILRISPRVNSNGLVTLDIDQEVSNVTATTSSTLNAPTFNQRRLLSSIVVQDGETVALGGLIRDNVNNGRSGIPILSELPTIGALFGTTTKDKTRTELIILLSPRVVRDSAGARAVTEELRSRLGLVKPLSEKLR